ncbi:MAG: hypothetical protein MK086_00945 [Flavobacteriales bacterium]|nr:hypothetical protein [Flavobacteriales bacterium]
MEIVQSWVFSVSALSIGIAAKFLLEFFIPEQKEKRNLLKKVLVNGSMSIIAIVLFGSLFYNISVTAWSQDQYVYVMFQAFLAVLSLAFLLVADTMKIFINSVTEVGDDDPERLRQFEAAFFAND